MQLTSKIVPCLWFDGQAEAAAAFYTSIFKDSRIVCTTRYPDAGQEIHGHAAGSVLTVEFELAGQPFTALNGGPEFQFSEAISFQVKCDTQEEIDYFWARLADGGQEVQCGWLKDRFGVSWQVVPVGLSEMFTDGDPARSDRAMQALLGMKKLDIAALERARQG
jgi:predicted 3-demethylubiquinone-9 3-methyltransferase (glyoxalase superfamily)